MRSRPTCRLLLCLVLFPGCQTVQLREGSLNQVASVGDIHERQVIDNLAKFAYEVNSFPSFSYVDTGAHQVQDTDGISSTTTWQRIGGGLYGWLSSTAVPSMSRQAYQSWTLKPINDPRKLDLMRCAYQKAVRDNLAAREVRGPAVGHESCDGPTCPDCVKRLNSFYTGKPNTAPPSPGTEEDTGHITANCLGTNPIWFAVGCKKDVPKHCKCQTVGHYCGTYVWVLPGGEDELAKLTLTILDFAMNPPRSPPTAPTKQGTLFIDANGNLTTPLNSVGFVTGVVPANQPTRTLVKADLESADAIFDAKLNKRAAEIKEMRNLQKLHATSVPRVGDAERKRMEALQADLMPLINESNSIKERLKGLKDLPPGQPMQRPSLDETANPSLLQIQQLLNIVRPIPPQ